MKSLLPQFLAIPSITARTPFFILLLATFFSLPLIGKEARFGKHELEGALIYNFTKHLSWDTPETSESFRIGILGSNTALYQELSSKLSSKQAQGKEIEVYQRKQIDILPHTQLLYISRDKHHLLREILEKTSGLPVLVLTEDYPVKHQVMINFTQTADERIQFEINRRNIEGAGITISPDLLLLGGTELDVTEIYHAMEDELSSLKSELLGKQIQLQEMEDRISRSNELIEIQTSKIDQQTAEVSHQEAITRETRSRLSILENSFSVLENSLRQKEAELSSQQAILTARQEELLKKEADILTAESQITQNRNTLDEQAATINEQSIKISAQNINLSNQRDIILHQREALISSLVAIFLTITSIILLYRFIRLRSKTNQHLEVKNDELKKTINTLDKLKDDLKEAKIEAELANHSKSLFLANISHEIRTPLNAIIGYSKMMHKNPSLSQKHTKFIEAINRSGSHLLGLINDVLTMSKIESGKSSVDFKTINISQLINDLIAIFSIQSTQEHLQFNCTLSKSVPTSLYSDRRKIRQILINLIGNAFKFTKKGSINLDVSVGKSKSRNTMTFKVSDTGTGIRQETLQSIFDPFEQGDFTSTGGTGLGLSISQKYAELLGGSITVDSTIDRGSVFTFTLQYDPNHPESKRTQVDDQPREGSWRVSSSSKRILALDDKIENLEILEYILEEAGLEVETTTDTKTLQKHAKESKPDLILLDMVLPDTTGEILAKEIKQDGELDQIPIIGVTANILNYHMDSPPEGLDAIIGKPITADILFSTIEKASNISFLKIPTSIHNIADLEINNTEISPSISTHQLKQIQEFAQLGDTLELAESIEAIRFKDAKLHSMMTSRLDRFDLGEILSIIQHEIEKRNIH